MSCSRDPGIHRLPRIHALLPFQGRTFPDLRFNLLKGRLQTLLSLFKSGIAGRRSLGKGGSEVKRGDILSRLVFQFFENW